MPAVEFGTGKTFIVLAIVLGCFAILWPKLFYPMLQAGYNGQTSSPAVPIDPVPVSKKLLSDGEEGCCDVVFEQDVATLISLCAGGIIRDKDQVRHCHSALRDLCGIQVDVATVWNPRILRAVLATARTDNTSACLQRHFGLTRAQIGAPRKMRLISPRHTRQERPPRMRPEPLHPALREKGRAIPPGHVVPRIMETEGRVGDIEEVPEKAPEKEAPGPLPGMRPPMGGAGHVVPAPKGSGTMGIIMPIYTIGIVVFFLYTIMRVMFKKPACKAAVDYDFTSDPEFRKMVFAEECGTTHKITGSGNGHHPWHTEDGTRLVVTAISGLLAEVDQHRDMLEKRAAEQQKEAATAVTTALPPQAKVEEPVALVPQVTQNKQEEVAPPPALSAPPAQEQETPAPQQVSPSPSVKVMGMETMAGHERGQRWSPRPETPPLRPPSRTMTATPPASEIYLEGSLPKVHQLLVAESETTREPAPDNDNSADPPVVLSGKMTLSLISLDSLGLDSADSDQEGSSRPRELESLTKDEPTQEKDESKEIKNNGEDIQLDDEEEEEEVEIEVEEEEDEEEVEVEVEEEEEEIEDKACADSTPAHVNDAIPPGEDSPPTSATNYTTAADAPNLTQEETAADVSALDQDDIEDDEAATAAEDLISPANQEVGEEEEEVEEEEEEVELEEEEEEVQIPNQSGRTTSR